MGVPRKRNMRLKVERKSRLEKKFISPKQDEEEEEEEEDDFDITPCAFPNMVGKRRQVNNGEGLVISLHQDICDILARVRPFMNQLQLAEITLSVVNFIKCFPNFTPIDKKHKSRSLTPSAWGCFFVVCLLSVATRLAYISEPEHVCWDETHFGKFANHYINGTFFFDVHPPMGKMSLALVGYLTGYDGTFPFIQPGDKFGDAKYVGMRVYCALMGCLCVPLVYLTVWELTMSTTACVLSSTFILFDHGCITLSQYILLDPILLFWCMASIYCVVKFRTWNDAPFASGWWRWMILTGVSLGCVLSVKWVGLFVILFVGVTTAYDLWEMLGDCFVSLKVIFTHIVARLLGLVVVPVTVYLGFFALHFKYLDTSGTGDAFFSSVFQSTLKGNKLHSAQIPIDVAYGALVTLKNHAVGGTYLHSHMTMFPPEFPPEQQQVTGYAHNDDNNMWKLHTNDSYYDEDDKLVLIKDGDVVRLMHNPSLRNLHSHNVRAPLSHNYNQVSGYGEDGVGDSNDLWKVQVVHGPGKNGVIQAVKTIFRLIHVETGCALVETGLLLPKWAFEQKEIACSPIVDVFGSEWHVEGNDHSQVPHVEISVMQQSFFEKVWESHVIMGTTNNAFKVKENEQPSLPHHWPILYKGQVFSGNDYRIYLLGNPVIWWFVLLCYGLFAGYYVFIKVRNKRKYGVQDKQLDTKSWDVIYTCGWLLIGWGLHYFPFFLMGRVLYFHHYFPAYLISTMVVGIFLEHMFHVVSRTYFTDELLRGKVYHGGTVVVVFISMLSFYAFRSLTYGMSGPMAFTGNSTFAAYKWLATWEL